MTDKRLTDQGISVLTDPVSGDLMHVVDVSDTTGSPQGTSKRATIQDIVIAGAAIPANVVIINSEADFAIQTATIITLENDTTYIPGASLVTAKSFTVGTNVTILGSNRAVLWEYTGTGDMFSGSNVERFEIFTITLRATNAIQLFNFIDITPERSFVTIENVLGSADGFNVICDKFGTFTSLVDLIITNVRMLSGLGFNEGITINGTGFSSLLVDTVLLVSFSSDFFVALDFTDIVFSGIVRVDTFIFISNQVGSVAISGLANSGNMNPDVLATFDNCVFAGDIIPLQGIVESDIRYKFMNCFPLPDSTVDFFTTMTASETVTVSVAGTFVPIAGGNWNTEKTNKWSIDNDGVATFLLESATDVKLEANASLAKVGGGSNLVALRINIDTGSGFPVPPPIRTQSETQSADPTNVTAVDLVTVSTGDRVRMEVANIDSGANDVIVSANARFLSLNGF